MIIIEPREVRAERIVIMLSLYILWHSFRESPFTAGRMNHRQIHHELTHHEVVCRRTPLDPRRQATYSRMLGLIVPIRACKRSAKQQAMARRQCWKLSRATWKAHALAFFSRGADHDHTCDDGGTTIFTRTDRRHRWLCVDVGFLLLSATGAGGFHSHVA